MDAVSRLRLGCCRGRVDKRSTSTCYARDGGCAPLIHPTESTSCKLFPAININYGELKCNFPPPLRYLLHYSVWQVPLPGLPNILNLGAIQRSYILSNRKHTFGIALALSMLIAAPVIADTGTVKFFNKSKGFGFISTDNGTEDVFVHISEVNKAGLDNLAIGDKVNYDLDVNIKKGRADARNIKVLK